MPLSDVGSERCECSFETSKSHDSRVATTTVELPPQPRDPQIILPIAPENPPVLADLQRALILKQQVVESFCMSIVSFIQPLSSLIARNDIQACTPEDVAHVMVYEHTLTHLISLTQLGPG